MHTTIETIAAILRATPERWARLAGTVPHELLARQPTPGEWSALECLQHLVATEEHVFPHRVQALLDGRSFVGFDPVAYHAAEPEAPDARTLAEHFAGLRTRSLEAIAGLQVESLSRTAQHSELGTVSLGELLNEWAAHDLNHTIQAERALMQPFIAACGPWRSYFVDHDVESI